MSDATPIQAGAGQEGLFPTTLWSEVRPKGGAEGQKAALEALSRRYQGPALAFLRAAFAVDHAQAEDLLQSFFVRLLERDLLQRADPERGRFRAFLKAALRHFATDEFRQRNALKRGGASAAPSWDESSKTTDPRSPNPELELDRAWRAAWIGGALEDVRAELEAQGKGAAYELFRDYYLAPGAQPDYRVLAERHGVSTTDVSNRLMRVKRIFRRHLKARVQETVDGDEDLQAELAWLLEEKRS